MPSQEISLQEATAQEISPQEISKGGILKTEAEEVTDEDPFIQSPPSQMEEGPDGGGQN
jgi:hypothetical protein